jgi:hypothetical protein
MKKKTTPPKKSAKKEPPVFSINSSQNKRSHLKRDHLISKFENVQKKNDLEHAHDDDVDFYKGTSDLMQFHQKQVEKRYQVNKKELKTAVDSEQQSFDNDMEVLNEIEQKKVSTTGTKTKKNKLNNKKI